LPSRRTDGKEMNASVRVLSYGYEVEKELLYFVQHLVHGTVSQAEAPRWRVGTRTRVAVTALQSCTGVPTLA
jgi:uncharacterized protein YbbC (DUF1343 family)